MACRLCSKNWVWEFTNQTKLCKRCFVNYFEKKLLKIVRKYGMRDSKIIKSDDLRGNVISSILGKIVTGKGKRLDIENLNDFSVSILEALMSKNINNFNKLKPCYKPLYFFSDAEINLYAKIKGIKGKITRKLNKKEIKIDSFLEHLESNNKDIRHNVVNSLSRL
jgi:hypothetical protein